MRFIAIGRTEILLESVQSLLDDGHELLLIITTPSEQYQYSKTEKDFLEYAKETGVECVITEKLGNEINEKIKSLKPDVAISYNWKTLIKKTTMDLFPLGVLNAHAGDIPRYKGNAVRNWAIMAGEKEMVLTIHQMSERLDEGSVVIKKSCGINDSTTIHDLYAFVSHQTPLLFAEALQGLQTHSLTPIEVGTNPEEHLRCFPRIPADSEINWTLSAVEINKLIRASSEPFTGAYTFIGYKKLIIWDADVWKADYKYLAVPGQVAERRLKTKEIVVATGQDFLVIKRCEIVDRDHNEAPTDIIKSIRTRLGVITTPIYDMNCRLTRMEKKIFNENRRGV